MRAPENTALVVDDDSLIRELIRDVLMSAGWLVTEAVDGEHALSCYAPGRFALVVLDIRMPRRDGLSTLVELRRAEASLPVLMITGEAPPEARLVAAADPCVRFLEKPFGLGMLQAAVDTLMGVVA